MKTKIFLERKSKIVVKPINYISTQPVLLQAKEDNKAVLATALKDIESLGFIFSFGIVDTISRYSIKDIIRFHKKVSNVIKEMIGVRKYKPMYPNFPKQVMEMSEAELYINAIIHYLTLELPVYEKEKRPPLREKTKVKVINLGTNEEFFKIFTNIVNSKVAMSPQDLKDVEWFVSQYGGLISSHFPKKIENKENLASITGIVKNHNLISDEFIKQYFKTATDVLRYVTVLSFGDVSLSSNTLFRKFRRSERSFILSILENCNNLAEDMLRYKNKWIRLGEILHPSEYKNKHPKCSNAFVLIRNRPEVIETFNRNIEKYIKSDDLVNVLITLKKKPGEFGRKLDWVLRKFSGNNDQGKIIDSFKSVIDKVSTTILLQLITHFRNRKNIKYRCFIPKGNIAKLMLIDNDLSHINVFATNFIVNLCEEALVKRFSFKESLGKVYIDKEMRNYTIPFAMRSATRALRTVSRGSKINMKGKGDTLRMFMWWKQPKGDRVDLDLSVMGYSEDWGYVQHVSYTNLRDNIGCHSGDITEAPKGASEFTDIDIRKAKLFDVRYVVMNILSYTRQKFEELPECFAGCMLRKNNMSGEIYEPKTVEYKFDITGQNKINIPLIFDLKENKIIWCDMDLSKAPAINCVETNQTGIVAIGKAMTTLNKPDLDTLFDLHFQARGTHLVEDKKDANTIFSIDEGVTPYDIDVITSEYL